MMNFQAKLKRNGNGSDDDESETDVDEEVSKQFQRILQKQGFKFLLGKKVTDLA